MTGEYRVQINVAAEADLTAIYKYLYVNASPEIAERMIQDFLDRTKALRTFPARGSRLTEFVSLGGESFRQIVAGKYRIIYRVIDREVTVMLIADGRRDMQALLRQRLLETPLLTPPGSPR